MTHFEQALKARLTRPLLIPLYGSQSTRYGRAAACLLKELLPLTTLDIQEALARILDSLYPLSPIDSQDALSVALCSFLEEREAQ